MNRTIKLRAWDTLLEIMWYGNETDGQYSCKFSLNDDDILCCNSYWQIAEDEPFSFTQHECIVMQNTGLKDKNGKEVYEGDILKSAYSVPLQVVFEDGKFCFHNDHSTGADILSQMRTKKLEIIGNIYENANLLTSTP